MITEALHVILDPGHILAEVVLEVVSYLTIGRLAIWWHDRRHHDPGPCSQCSEGHTFSGDCELRIENVTPRCGICGGRIAPDGTHFYE